MLDSGENVLVRPDKWEDPYEKALQRSTFCVKDDDKTRNYSFNGNHWYAQCWSMTPESDALWKVFAPNRKEMYVKIKTTYGLLRESYELTDDEKEKEYIPYYALEAINYVEDNKAEYEKSIKQWVEYFKFSVPEGQMLCLGLLLTKRKAFEYEHEVRLLRYREPIDTGVTDMDSKSDHLYKYDIECRKLILEVEFDPWTKKVSKDEKQKIAKIIGRGKVKKSKLYEMPLNTQYTIEKKSNLGLFEKLLLWI